MTGKKDSPESAQSVLAEYYDDLLGSLSASPLVPDSHNEEAAAEANQASKKPDELSLKPATVQDNQHLPKESGPPVSRQMKRSKVADNLATEPVQSIPFPKLASPKIQAAEFLSSPIKPPTKRRLTARTPDQDVPKESVSTTVTDTVASETSSLQDAKSGDQEGGFVTPPQAWCDNGRPVWAQESFDCLLFDVAGLTLAVPLIALGSIHRIENPITPLVGQIDWFIGLYQSGEGSIQVVDTAKWVMPNRYTEGVVERYQFLIRLADSKWGLACDSVAHAIRLDPTQVKWRTQRSQRPWLSGTVIEHMCALLDAETFNVMLHDASKKADS